MGAVYVCFVSISLMIFFVDSIPELKLQAAGSGVFENTVKGKRVNGFRIKTRRIRSRSSCASICNRTPNCLSINFCGRETCELSEEDIFSTADGDAILANDERCTYVGMHRHDIPLCREEESFVDIKDDTRTGKCNIKGKRVDLQWGEWGESIVTNDSSVKFIRVQRRAPEVEAAHGGIASGKDEKVSCSEEQ